MGGNEISLRQGVGTDGKDNPGSCFPKKKKKKKTKKKKKKKIFFFEKKKKKKKPRVGKE